MCGSIFPIDRSNTLLTDPYPLVSRLSSLVAMTMTRVHYLFLSPQSLLVQALECCSAQVFRSIVEEADGARRCAVDDWLLAMLCLAVRILYDMM